MKEKTQRKLGIALFMLGFIIIWINGVAVVGHYVIGWSPIFSIDIIVGAVLLVIGMAIATRKHPNPEKDGVL